MSDGLQLNPPHPPNRLYALRPDGSTNWSIALSNGGYGAPGAPAIGIDGSVYFTDFATLYSLSPQGTTNWMTQVSGNISQWGSPSIGPDGTIYVTGSDLYAVAPTGQRKWVLRAPDSWSTFLISSPAIGSDGTIYVGNDSGQLYAVNPDGTVRWTAPTASHGFDSSPSIGPASICFAPFFGFYSVSFSGGSNWNFYPSPGTIQGCSPAFGASGNVYWGQAPGLFELQPNGTSQAVLQDSVYDLVCSSPTISQNGVLYVASFNGDIYDQYGEDYGPPGTLHAYQIDTPPAQSSWPMYRGNPQHTGRTLQASLGIRRGSGGGIGLSLNVESTASYSLESSSDLKTWSEMLTLTSPALPVPELTYPLTSGRLFYRLRVLTNAPAQLPQR
jgi:outer membrane protein assembly factor BamB